MATSITPTSKDSTFVANGLRVQVATFNCNLQGMAATKPDLQPWLIPTLSEKDKRYSTSESGEGRQAPDIYAVGFQELLPLHVGFANSQGGIDAISHTDSEIRRAIRPHAALTRADGKYGQDGGPENYSLVAESHLVGLAVFVYAREKPATTGGRSIAARVKEVRTGLAGTGLLGLLGNKGAVGVRIVLEGAEKGSPDEVLSFACAHLAAHDHNVPRRNRDWKNIVRRLVFAPDAVGSLPPLQESVGSSGGPPDTAALQEKYEGTKSGPRAKPAPLDQASYSLYDSSYLFVFGDLNYRIAFGKPAMKQLLRKGAAGDKLKKVDVKRKIAQGDWKTLAAYDQLSMERLAEPPRVFQGLTEPLLSAAGFGPTYKYKVIKPGHKYKEGEKPLAGVKQELSAKRVPGWTDRILYAGWGQEGDEKSAVQVELYRSIMLYDHSDHKPVTTIFRLPQPTSGSSSPLRLAASAPYSVDPLWRQKRAVGQVLDRVLGLIWSALVVAGGGNIIAGILEAVVVAILSAWWLLDGGGQNDDMGWWLGNLIGRP